MTNIADNIRKIQSEIPENVCLVAVSKTKPDEDLMVAYDAGQRIFGENKVQELTGKAERLPKDIQWHMIGHLQTNKVKYIAPFVSLIHAVDSIKLLKTINKEALKNDRVIPCLLQMHIAEESEKFGFKPEDIEQLSQETIFSELKNIRICGVMGMATFTEDQAQIRREFALLKNIFDRLKNSTFSEQEDFATISMGMSGDYPIAIEEGSNMVRIGSTIFGARNYNNANSI